uniref:Uncharacterized protein n=1 Tax=Tanacetum cinerariifolium TaxID=118510 RepID=A0A699KQL8_TANCI|nr:hypothetical protein [Tanacetum cinerariifolium]
MAKNPEKLKLMIRLQPVGVSCRIMKFVQRVPLSQSSEYEGDDEAATLSLASDLGRVNKASTKSVAKLQEIGPRMTL